MNLKLVLWWFWQFTDSGGIWIYLHIFANYLWVIASLLLLFASININLSDNQRHGLYNCLLLVEIWLLRIFATTRYYQGHLFHLLATAQFPLTSTPVHRAGHLLSYSGICSTVSCQGRSGITFPSVTIRYDTKCQCLASNSCS